MRRFYTRPLAVLAICGIGYLMSLDVSAAWADSTTPSGSSTAPLETRTYVTQAAAADQFEIESSKLALTQSKNADIHKFAQMMIHDHTASTDKLKAVLKKEKADEPAAALDAGHQAQLDSLKSQAGESFDAAYIKAQLQGHQDALSLHQSYAASGADKGLKAFAANTAKVVQMHLSHVQALAKKLNMPE